MDTVNISEEDRHPLETVNFLRIFGLQRLADDYKISYKQHGKLPNLFLFKYDQVKSPFNERITQECRGLILDRTNNWEPVVIPYYKFFNYGESNATKDFDWSSVRTFEKVDGCLAVLYYYKNDWHVSSSGIPDARACNVSFRACFDTIWTKMKYKRPTDTNKIYVFEMLTKNHQIVCEIERDELILHGCRDMQNYEEVDPVEIGKKYGYKVVHEYPELDTEEKILAAAKLLNPTKQEGFVVCDSQYRRLKIKSPNYVAIHLLKDNGSDHVNFKALLNLIRVNETDEFLSYFPKWKKLHGIVSTLYRRLCADLEDIIDVLKPLTPGSEAAQAAIHKAVSELPNAEVYSAVLATVHSKALEFADYFRDCPLSEIVAMLERYEAFPKDIRHNGRKKNTSQPQPKPSVDHSKLNEEYGGSEKVESRGSERKNQNNTNTNTSQPRHVGKRK